MASVPVVPGGGGWPAAPTGVWVWADDYGGWQHMMQQDSDVIEQAFVARQQSVNFQVNQGHRLAMYTVDFMRMVQINMATGFERGVRRLLGPGAPHPVNNWFFRDENGTYNTIDMDVCALFDEMQARGLSVFNFNVGDSRFTYLADLNTMTQTNLMTGKVRQLLSQPRAGGGQQQEGAAGQAAVGGGRHPMQDVMDRCKDVTDQIKGDEDDVCIVCYNGFSKSEPALQLPLCTHYFHELCIKPWLFSHSKCPTCSQQYGPTTGNMPPGRMTSETLGAGRCPLQGLEQHGTIRIHFNIPGGIQTAEHPNPGVPYTGTSRTCYLPDTPEGRDLLDLVQRAFNQRLMFTIGRSITTGIDNTVVWNGIHMKTRTHGGAASHGYPDPGYLSRLRAELKAKGIE